MSTIIFLLVVAVICVAVYLRIRTLTGRLETAQERNRHLSYELAAYKSERIKIDHVIRNSVGGVGKRIAETRQITEAIFSFCPLIFAEKTGLFFWLKANEQFLVELMQAADTNDPMQKKIADSEDSGIYARIQKTFEFPEVA